jgi:hypothetical protein
MARLSGACLAGTKDEPDQVRPCDLVPKGWELHGRSRKKTQLWAAHRIAPRNERYTLER